ncbi:MAG: EAL domain-containing protein [Granulosicoccus sp.]|nr:EAL domain-containing protein [Granulosicoccus sp.]
MELCERPLDPGMAETLRQAVTRLQADRLGNDISPTQPRTMFTDHPSRTAGLSVSVFPMEDGKQALLVEVLHAGQDAGSDRVHGATALQLTPAMISLYDADHELIYCNPAARETLPDRCTNLRQRLVSETDMGTILDALDSSDSYDVELEVNTVDGARWHQMNFRRSVIAPGGHSSMLVSAQDATEARRARQLAHELAFTDSLTGLPNRAALGLYLEELLDAEGSDRPEFSLLFLDLDRFKIINDSMGHAIGDQLLMEVAQRLKNTVGGNGLVCRLGGDEFVLIINRFTATAKLARVAEGILHVMAEPVVLNGQKLRTLPSIGISRHPADGEHASELIEHADEAMYLAKSRQSGYCFFDSKMTARLNEKVKDRLGLENDLVFAVQNNEFELYYQPKICSRTLAISGVEALIRWNHPTRGQVAPDNFISIAEETGQILELGNWVLDAAMKQQRQWQDAGLIVPVSINISARQFYADDLLLNVSECLLRNGCDPARIELELTESMLLGDAEAVHQTLHQLSSMGIKLALDDFGTGFSNLAYLQKYPLDILKIDRAFLADQTRSMLMGTILEMGKVLGLCVVAEGVETAAQVDWLIGRGCDQMQGYYFSRPLPAADATRYLVEKLADGHLDEKAA